MGSRAVLLLLLQRLKERAPLFPRPFHRSISARPRLVPPVLLAGTVACRRFGKYGSVNLVLSRDGERKPRFELVEEEAPKKEKWRTKKRLKMQRKREKRKRKEASKRDPRRVRPKGKKIKQKFPTAEDRLKYKIEKVNS